MGEETKNPHPLDPCSAEELTSAVALLRDTDKLSERAFFSCGFPAEATLRSMPVKFIVPPSLRDRSSFQSPASFSLAQEGEGASRTRAAPISRARVGSSRVVTRLCSCRLASAPGAGALAPIPV